MPIQLHDALDRLSIPCRTGAGVELETKGKGSMPFFIISEYIKLDSFLKAVNVVGSGGEAKVTIAEGNVRVNGSVELRRGRKLRPGDRVELGGYSYLVERQP